MEGESRVNRSVNNELHSSDIQGDKTAGESGVTRSISVEFHSTDFQGNQI